MGSLRDPVTTEGESLRVERLAQPKRQFSNQDDVQLASYVSGYVDGEGCFSVSLSPRCQLATGWEVRPSFSVSQNDDRSSFLYDMQRYFECGAIRPDRSDKTLKFEVRSLRDLLRTVIPHFQRFPLRSEKQQAFVLFAEICQMMHRKEHLHTQGVDRISLLAGMINQGKRKYSRKDIVYATRNGGMHT